MKICTRLLSALLLAASMLIPPGLSVAADADTPAPKSDSALFKAPNPVSISPLLMTSGQPDAQTLSNLGAQGYAADIYLAPPNVGDAVREEQMLVGKQGILFINLPIRFGAPREEDFQAFAGILKTLEKRKVLVHCQVNFRASAMVFLYRVLINKEDPHSAYEAVSKVWVPDNIWKQFIRDMLQKHGVKFEPLD